MQLLLVIYIISTIYNSNNQLLVAFLIYSIDNGNPAHANCRSIVTGMYCNVLSYSIPVQIC